VLPLPRLKSLPGLAACLLLATGIQAGDFRMEPADSRLRFRAVAEKAEFEGRFTRFDSIARFDPADLAGSRIEATVDTGSVNTANGQRDELLVGADWFASSRWPRARFVTRRIEALGDGYRAEAELTLRDRTRPVVMDFRWQPLGDGARLQGTVQLRRLDFDVGTGEWRDTRSVADGVTVEVDVHYVPSPP
jgi:polyisoprenoid-binding protein YceI